MDVENMEEAGKTAKNLADRRFAAFKGDIQVIINMRMFDKDNHKLFKDLKRDVGHQLIRYEDILTHLENFELISSRGSIVREKGL